MIRDKEILVHIKTEILVHIKRLIKSRLTYGYKRVTALYNTEREQLEKEKN